MSAVRNIERSSVSQTTKPHGTTSTGSAASEGGAIESQQAQAQAQGASPAPQSSSPIHISADVTIVIAQTAAKTRIATVNN